ncbi:TPR repeat-containing protein, partial [mine drainage metagenome]
MVEEFSTSFSGIERPFIIIENLHRLSVQSLDMFLYFARMSEKLGFTLIGVSENTGAQNNTDRFIAEAKTIPSINIIQLKRPEMEDVKRLLKEENYKLEEAFIKDLVRLVNGNLNVLSYTLSYYREEGFIDPDGSLNSVRVRFFPIPPSLETHYKTIFLELDDTSMDILKVLTIIRDRLSVEELCYLSNREQVKILDSLSKLESKQLVKSEQRLFSIQNDFLYTLLSSYLSGADRIKFSGRINSSDLVNRLPISARITMNLNNGNTDEAMKILNENVETINNEVNTPQDVYESIIKVIPMLKDETLRNRAKYAEGKALYTLARYNEALEIFKSTDFLKIGLIEPYILTSSIYNLRGDYKNSQETIDNIMSRGNLKPIDEAKLLVAKATISLRKNEYALAEEQANIALDISRKNGYGSILADCYNIIGIIKIYTFNIEESREYFKNALEINRVNKTWTSILKNMNNLSISNGMLGNYEDSIKNFKEIVDISYITSDLRGRAYAEYNLVEQLDILGDYIESEDYIPTAEKLISLISDSSLSSSFYRFLGLHLLQSCNFEEAFEKFKVGVQKSKEAEDNQKTRICNFLANFTNEIIKGERINETDEEIAEKFELEEDFIPVVYILICLRYLILKDFGKALSAA